MFLIHGVYRWWPKRVGFRNDYCLSCEGPRRSIATRTFDVGHVFFVPLIPVGFWKHWACSACRRDPHRNPKARPFLKWVGFACLIILSLMFWSVPINSEDVAILGWILRIGPLVGAAALLFQILTRADEPSLRERLAEIAPAATDSACPFCATPLMAGDGGQWSCPACRAVRY